LQQIAGKVAGVKLPAVAHLNPLTFISDVADLWMRLEREKTERRRIEAETEVRLAEIRERSAVFLEYIDRAFAERSENFRRLFQLADRAMDEHNHEALAVALHGVVELAKTTPFSQLADMERTKKMLLGPPQEFVL
jgi:hypothetical protein